MDSSNAIYVADYENNRIQKWSDNAPNATTVAGNATGLKSHAQNALNLPTTVIIDLDGNMYVTDSDAHRVQLWRKGASTGVTIAGTGKNMRRWILNKMLCVQRSLSNFDFQRSYHISKA